MPNHPTILFAGGGTGGHVAPLLAVMEEVHAADPDAKLVYVGTAQDAASPMIATSQLPFTVHVIKAGKLHRFLSLDQFKQSGRAAVGLVQAFRLLKTVKPDAVFSKGGMVGLPVAIAAARKGIPIYSHETDAAAGLVNKLIGKYAKTIFTAFSVEAYRNLPASKLAYVGQPVRREFYAASKTWQSMLVGERELERVGTPIVTVLCGSQGSRQVNALVEEAWPELLKTVRLVHLTGSRNLQELRLEASSLPASLRNNLFLTDFLAEGLPELLSASAAVIGRSGGSVFELAACKTPSVLIPLASSAQNHQRLNAAILQEAGAALVLDGQEATSANLVATVTALVDSPKDRQIMANHIALFAKPGAAAVMAKTILSEMTAPNGN